MSQYRGQNLAECVLGTATSNRSHCQAELDAAKPVAVRPAVTSPRFGGAGKAGAGCKGRRCWVIVQRGDQVSRVEPERAKTARLVLGRPIHQLQPALATQLCIEPLRACRLPFARPVCSAAMCDAARLEARRVDW